MLTLLASNLCFLGIPEFLKRAVDALKRGDMDAVPSAVVLLIVFALATAVTRILSRVWIFNTARWRFQA